MRGNFSSICFAALFLFFVYCGSAQAATFTVNTFDDPPPVAAPNGCNTNGSCSLREAVLAANNSNEPNTILLGEGTYSLTIPEANSRETGDLDFTGPIAIFDVTLQGAGQDKTFIVADPGLDERILDFNGNFITVTISDLTLQNGNSPGLGGGAIVVSSNATTTIKNVTFLDNKSVGSGGGLYCVNGTTTTDLQNVSFSGNQSDGAGGALVNGGGNITLSIDGGTYSDNQAGTDGGAMSLFGVGVAPVTIKNITVSNNIALNGNGGGIHRNGGTNFPIELENVQVLNNSAGNPGGQGNTGEGGGIYISANDADVNGTVKNSLIQGNSAAGESGTAGGGGLWIGSSKLFRMDNTAVKDNQALNGKNGGGIFFQNGGLQVFGSTFSGNSAGNGGGLQVNVFGAVREVTNSTISGNHADNAGGGLASGGGVAVTLNNVTVTLNSALTGAGLSNTNFGSHINIQNSIFAANVSNDGSGQTDDCSGPSFTSLGYNVFASAHNTDCTTDGVSPGTATNDTTSDPKLGPLTDNGGPTQTHALLAGSSALDGGNPNGCTDQSGTLLGTDQRGVTRPQGPACDIGSYEVEVDLCSGDPPPNCDDGNVCTDDSCDPASGCTHEDNTNSCEDGNACTTSDACSSGSCVGGAPLSCDDANACTSDSCDPILGCQHVNPCDDGNPCTVDSCQAKKNGALMCKNKKIPHCTP